MTLTANEPEVFIGRCHQPWNDQDTERLVASLTLNLPWRAHIGGSGRHSGEVPSR